MLRRSAEHNPGLGDQVASLVDRAHSRSSIVRNDLHRGARDRRCSIREDACHRKSDRAAAQTRDFQNPRKRIISGGACLHIAVQLRQSLSDQINIQTRGDIEKCILAKRTIDQNLPVFSL